MAKPLLIFAGATASGKSDLALSLAREVNGEILAIDSVQVFRGFNIGSAKASVEEMRTVPHHLVDCLDPTEEIDAQRFVVMVEKAVDEIEARGRRPILVGGTTMYLTALLHGLMPAPGIPESLLAEVRSASLEQLYEMLRSVDPESALRISPNDRSRLERALAVSRVSGKPYSTLRDQHSFSSVKHRALIVVPTWERAALYRRIDQRVEKMLHNGLRQEVKELVDHNGVNLHGLRSLGYAQCLKVLQGEMADSLLADEIAKATRRFAKRQLTFLRNEPRKRGWRVIPDEVPGKISAAQSSASRAGARYEEVCEQVTRRQLKDRMQEIWEQGLDQTEVWFLDAGCLGL